MLGRRAGRASAHHVNGSVARARRPGLRATAMAASATVVAMLPVYLIGGLAIQLENDLGVTAGILGAIVAFYWAVSALLSATAGRIAQGLSARAGLLLAVAFGLIALLGISIAAPSWQWLILWLGFAGAANALSHPLANSLIADQVSIRNRGLAFGLKQAATPIATLAAGLSVPLLALTVGWKWAFVIAAGFAVVLIPALIVIVPKRHRVKATKARGRNPKVVLPQALKPFLFVTAIASGLGAAQANILGAFTVSSAFAAGFDVGAAGLLLGVASAASCLARPLVGIAADRGIGGSMATVALMMAVGCAGLVCMASGNMIAFGIGCVLAFGFGWGWNGLAHYVISRRAHPFTARATGITQSGTYIGGSLGPLIFGLIFAYAGPTAGWLLASVVAAMAVIAALAAYRLEKALIASPKI